MLLICETPPSTTCTVPQAGGSFLAPPSCPCSSGKGAGITWHPRLSPRECSGPPQVQHPPSHRTANMHNQTEKLNCTALDPQQQHPLSCTWPQGHSHDTNHGGMQPSRKPGSRIRARHQAGLPRGLCGKPWMSQSPLCCRHMGMRPVSPQRSHRQETCN